MLAAYPACRYVGLAPTLLRRIAAGLVCVLLAFVAGATLQFFIEQQPSALPIYYQAPNRSFQLPQLWLLATSEALVIPSFLALAYQQTPPHLRNSLAAVLGLTGALGSFLNIGVQVNLTNCKAVVDRYSPNHWSFAYFAYAGLDLVSTPNFRSAF